MKAIQYRAYGGFEENRLVDLPVPDIAEGEVLVEMPHSSSSQAAARAGPEKL